MISARYDAHLIFDNSPTPERYFYSSGSATAPSTLGLIRGKLPVSENAVSPPNSLRLSWCSGRGGDWEAVVEVEPRRVRAETLQGDTLSFWCFTAAPIEAAALPLLALGLHGGQTLAFRLGQFTSDLTGGQWQHLKIPLSAFGGSTGEQNLLRLERLVLSQSIDDGEPHTLLLDEIRILDSTLAGELSTPTDLSARGYPHHIDLAWKHEPDEHTAYVLVQRARPGEDFVAIGIQRPEVNRFSDYLGQPGMRARYRVCAVGYDYLESARSAIAEAETRSFSDDELLDMVQRAHIRPYAERAHPEAGLALECLPGDDNLVALGTCTVSWTLDWPGCTICFPRSLTLFPCQYTKQSLWYLLLWSYQR